MFNVLDEFMGNSKKKLALSWVLGGGVSSAIGIILSVIYWSNVNPGWKLDMAGEIMGITVMLPIGWVFCAIIPMSFPSTAMSWISIGSFVWAFKSGKKNILYISYAACFVFGVFWPMTFWTMMSV